MPFSWWTSFTNGRRGTNKQWTNTHHPSSTSTSLLHALCVYTGFLCIHRFFLGLSYYVYLKKLYLTKHHKSDSGMKMSYRNFFPSSLQNMFVVLWFAFWPFQNLSHQKAMTSLLLPMYLLWIKWGSCFQSSKIQIYRSYSTHVVWFKCNSTSKLNIAQKVWWRAQML